jgi:hemin uptake protein HemP
MKTGPANGVPSTVQAGTTAAAAPAPTVKARTQPPRLIRSDDLLGGHREVLIEHAGEFYSLRHTSKGKLILTK